MMRCKILIRNMFTKVWEQKQSIRDDVQQITLNWFFFQLTSMSQCIVRCYRMKLNANELGIVRESLLNNAFHTLWTWVNWLKIWLNSKMSVQKSIQKYRWDWWYVLFDTCISTHFSNWLNLRARREGDWEWEGERVRFLIKSSTTIAETEAATMWLN